MKWQAVLGIGAVLLAPLLLERLTAEPPIDPETRAAWQTGDQLMRTAAEKVAVDPPAAQGAAAQAAGAYLAATARQATAPLLHNLGTARLEANDAPGAVAALRAALLLDPGAADSRANLEEARSRLDGSALRIEERPVDRARRLWSGLGDGRLDWGWILWCAGWAAFAWGLSSGGLRAARARHGGLALIALGASLLATVAIDAVRISVDRSAVLTSPAVLRKGNGESFAPVLAAPLAAGSECRVGESRPGWTEIEIGSGIRGWVPSDRIGSIRALANLDPRESEATPPSPGRSASGAASPADSR